MSTKNWEEARTRCSESATGAAFQFRACSVEPSAAKHYRPSVPWYWLGSSLARYWLQANRKAQRRHFADFWSAWCWQTEALKKLTRMCQEAALPLLCAAFTGVAAGSMMDAKTLHSQYIIPILNIILCTGHDRSEWDSVQVTREKGKASNQFLKLLTYARIQRHIETYMEAIAKGLAINNFCDEISMVSAGDFFFCFVPLYICF